MTSPWASSAVHRFHLLAGFAAQLAFFLALSLVPFVAVTVTMAGRWLPLDVTAEVEQVLRDVLPAETHIDPADVFRWARSSASTGWLTASFFLAILTSFNFIATCLRGIRAAVTGEIKPDGTPWRSTLSAALLVVVWVLALLATALLLLVAPSVERGLLSLHELADLTISLVAAARVVVVAGMLFGATFLTYRLAPIPRVRAGRTVVAALATPLGWLLVSSGFSKLAPELWGGAQLYGTLGSVVLFLLWAYVNAWTMLLGSLVLIRPRRAG
jgi:membrane protein